VSAAPPTGNATSALFLGPGRRFRGIFRGIGVDIRTRIGAGAGISSGLRPDVLAPMLDTPDRMIVMVPTEEFRQHQIRTLPRASALTVEVSDPMLAQANRVARDRLLAEHAVRAAREHGVHVLEIDGSRDAEASRRRRETLRRPSHTTHLTARLSSKSPHRAVADPAGKR